MKFEGKKSPRGPQRDKLVRIKGKSIAFDDAFLGGSSTWARTRDLRINSPALYRLSYRGMYSVFSQKTASKKPDTDNDAS